MWRILQICLVIPVLLLLFLFPEWLVLFPSKDILRRYSFNPTLAEEALYLCKVSYCPMDTVYKKSCGPTCDRLAEYTLYRVYDNESYGTLGASFIHHKAQRIVFTFRGSQNLNNWISNLDFWQVVYPSEDTVIPCGEECGVHHGFYEAFRSLESNLTNDVLELTAKFPLYDLFLTGHSLGGALALLGAVHVASNGVFPWNTVGGNRKTPAVVLYTFGEPRVGNAAFNKWSMDLIGGNQFRLTHGRDPVPHLPPRSWGYVHYPQELWEFQGNESTEAALVTCSDTWEAEDPLCSNSIYSTTISDHLLYLNTCTQCVCTPEVMKEIEALDQDTRLKEYLHKVIFEEAA